MKDTAPAVSAARLTAKRDREGLTFAESTRRLKLQRQAQLDTEASEQRTEARTFASRLSQNPHD